MRRIRRWLGRHAIEQQMRDEMQFHLEARIDTLIAQGMPPVEAARRARLEFGSMEAYREECRASLGYRPWDELRADLRYAARNLRHQPGYAATAIAILALGIGVNSAFFLLYSQYVLKPLPVRGAERHFDVTGRNARAQAMGGWTNAEIDAFRQAPRTQVEGLYTARTVQVLVLTPQQRPSAVSFVSGNYFQLLGGSAAQGRTFSEPEQREPVAVLSHSGQRRHFAGDALPVGRKLRVRTTVFTVIGVMPPEFTGTDAVVPDFWVGAEMHSALLGPQDNRERRYHLSGLLAPGVSLQQAESVLTAVASRFPRPADQRVAQVRLTGRTGVLAADDGFEVAAAVLFAAFQIVLLIACANLANLGLARAVSRTHEIGMRLSLGASRGRIVRQLLTESTFTALLGAAGGVALGSLAIAAVQRYLAPLAAGMGIAMLPVHMDWRVILFSAALGVVAGLAFGLVPAIEMTTPALTLSTRRDHSAFAGRLRPRRMRNFLIAGQVAASLVLLMVAGILVRHIRTLNMTSTGYDLHHIFDLKLDSPHPALLASLAQQPGVAAVSAVERVPLYGALPQHAATAGGQAVRLAYNSVDHRYFAVLGLPIEGRGFTAQEAASNARVVVISQATARRLWPGAAPLGQLLRIDKPEAGSTLERGSYEVIGVVPDVVSGWLFRGRDTTAVYFPAAAGQQRIQSAIARVHGTPASAVAAMRKVCAEAADATGCEPVSLRELSNVWRFPFAAAACIAGALGVLALALTAVGLYGVTSCSVVQRRREIGVYLAVGASPVQVMRRLLREALRCVLIGMALGLPVCLILSWLMRSSVFGIAAFDAGAYAVAPALLSVIVALACAVPARRATRIDPIASLREE